MSICTDSIDDTTYIFITIMLVVILCMCIFINDEYRILKVLEEIIYLIIGKRYVNRNDGNKNKK